jgi:hypothetical protein
MPLEPLEARCKCGVRFNVTPEIEGRRVRCPRCGRIARIPSFRGECHPQSGAVSGPTEIDASVATDAPSKVGGVYNATVLLPVSEEPSLLAQNVITNDEQCISTKTGHDTHDGTAVVTLRVSRRSLAVVVGALVVACVAFLVGRFTQGGALPKASEINSRADRGVIENQVDAKKVAPEAPEVKVEQQVNKEPGDEAVVDIFGAIMSQAMEQRRREQQQRSEAFDRVLQQGSICSHCGGAGVYRYVDQSGRLVANRCPTCLGTGRRN